MSAARARCGARPSAKTLLVRPRDQAAPYGSLERLDGDRRNDRQRDDQCELGRRWRDHAEWLAEPWEKQRQADDRERQADPCEEVWVSGRSPRMLKPRPHREDEDELGESDRRESACAAPRRRLARR